MIVSVKEMEQNFMKYFSVVEEEDIIIVQNGIIVGRLSAIGEKESWKDAFLVKEEVAEYFCGGRKASYEEFLRLRDETQERYEYIDGEIYLLASPKTTHQMVLTEILVIFHSFFQDKTCIPFVAPYDITLKRPLGEMNMVQPDIMVICDLYEELGEDDYYKGVPALLVEILSVSTRRKDRIKKLDLYRSCGVSEYWIVDPEKESVTVYYFQDREIQKQKEYQRPEVVKSFVFSGLTIDLEIVFSSHGKDL